jgi:hypothetical protein
MTMKFFSNAISRVVAVVFAATVTLLGCQRDDAQRAAPDSAAMPGHSDSASRMTGMPGMMKSRMMDSMQTHMRMMDTMSADQIKAMLPMHRRMAANMLSQMNAEMQGMTMAGDARWSATVDSIRQDLIRMPEMGAQELKAMMPAHHTRMTRLMQMHRDMMRRMAGAGASP